MTAETKKPYLTPEGELINPLDSDPKYQWWKPGGQSLAKTLEELDAPFDVLVKYIGEAEAKKAMEKREEASSNAQS